MSIEEAKVWFSQARSDFRTAEALREFANTKLKKNDVGCHSAAMCAQTIEKSIKGYMILNRVEPKLDHRPDKYLPDLLTKGNPLLRYRDHYNHL